MLCFVVASLALTLLLGHFAVKWFVALVRKLSNLTERYPEAVPAWIVGMFERAMTFVLFLFAVEDAGTVLIAWMAAKLAANWQRRELTNNERKSLWIRAQTFVALMAGVLSLAIGVLGGSIAHCALPTSENPNAWCKYVDRHLIHSKPE
jgi:hypothetical protein